MQVTLGQQYNVGEKPTVILYIYINRHAGMSEPTTTLFLACASPYYRVNADVRTDRVQTDFNRGRGSVQTAKTFDCFFKKTILFFFSLSLAPHTCNNNLK